MILRGVSHLHTKYSYDGTLSIRELRDFLIEKNIEFALLTEHSDFIEPNNAEKFIKDCHNLSDEKFTFIPGFEVPYRDAHILMIGVNHFVKNGKNSAEDLKKWKKHAEIAIWAHPHKNRYLLYDAIKAVIDGIEVWNSHYDGKRAPRMKVLNSLSGLRERGQEAVAFAGLDFHRKEHIGGPSIMVEAPNSAKYILEELKKGEFVLKNEQITIRSDGAIMKGILPLVKVQSAYYIFVVTTLKRVSKFVAAMGLPIPQKLRHNIRKKL